MLPYLQYFYHTTFLVFFFVTNKKKSYVVTRYVCPSVHPSSVEISLERGSKRSAEPIDLKIGLNMDT